MTMTVLSLMSLVGIAVAFVVAAWADRFESRRRVALAAVR